MDEKMRLVLLLILAALLHQAQSACYDAAPKAPLTTPQDWIEKSVNRHNEYRVRHGACPLVHNEKLSEIAQQFANRLAATRGFEHSQFVQTTNCIGENLAMKGSTGALDIDSNFAVDAWYDEIKDYNFETGDFEMKTGHLTQVLWKGSKEVGTAYASYQDGEWTKYVVVANYFPGGNMIGAFQQNVFAKGAKLPDECKDADKSFPNDPARGASSEVFQKHWYHLLPAITSVILCVASRVL